MFAFGSLCTCGCFRRGKFKFIDGTPYIHLGSSQLFLDRVSSRRNHCSFVRPREGFMVRASHIVIAQFH